MKKTLVSSKESDSKESTQHHTHPKSYYSSMADLVPLVATVLRDKAMVDMVNERETLKRLVDDRFKVQITGKQGSPVYCEGSLKNGYCSHRGRCFEVIFDDDDDDDDDNGEAEKKDCKTQSERATIPLAAVEGLEIRLGGSVVERLSVKNTLATCNAPFFTEDDFYRDARFNKPKFLAHDRKEIILKIKNHTRLGTVPFVIARFGDEMDFRDYEHLGGMNLPALTDLSKSGRASTIVLEGITFSKPEIQETLSVLSSMGYGRDEGNGHEQYIRSVDEKRIPVRRKPTITKSRSPAREMTTMVRSIEKTSKGNGSNDVQSKSETQSCDSMHPSTPT